MLVTLRSENGRRTEGVLLAMDEDRIRVAVHGLNETLEYRRMAERWCGDKGDFVEIESIVFPNMQPAVMRAGQA